MASGFKNSSRMRSGFNFSPSAGFTSSTGKVQNISYSRKTPRRRAALAEGGKVPPKVPPTPPPNPPDTGKGTTMRDILHGRKKQMEDLGLRSGGRVAKAEGGVIDSSLHSFKGDSQLNVEHGPSGGLRPGFTRGGYAAKYAKGGRIPASKAADRAAGAAVARHVATPAPKGHKGLGSKLKGC